MRINKVLFIYFFILNVYIVMKNSYLHFVRLSILNPPSAKSIGALITTHFIVNYCLTNFL